jgi:hypothetical protein
MISEIFNISSTINMVPELNCTLLFMLKSLLMGCILHLS